MATPACATFLLLRAELLLPASARDALYILALAYCFLGLSAITSRFFRSMENVVRQTREVTSVDPATGEAVVRREKIWNYTIADITLLAFGTSFPQISLAVINSLQNLGQLHSGGLGPGTLVGSAAFDLFPIHAICVIVPKAGTLKKISNLGVWIVELFWSFWAYIWLYFILQVWTPNVVTLLESFLTVLQFGLLLLHAYVQDKRWPYLSIPWDKSERPDDWVPEEASLASDNEFAESCDEIEVGVGRNKSIVDIFSIHSNNSVYHALPPGDVEESKEAFQSKILKEDGEVFRVWLRQFTDALKLESLQSKKLDGSVLRMLKISWNLVLFPWKFLFAFVPPVQLAHGWIAFACSLMFISGIAYCVTKLTDSISCVTGINPYVIAFTALASGTSWPDLVASKIAAERQLTADSAIANITCSNSVNIYIGIGIPWLINTAYNYLKYQQPLQVPDAEGLSFSLLVFFATSAGCISVLVLRRITLGAELGGPRLWAWTTFTFFMLLWLVFIVLSSLKVSGMI